MAKSTAYRLLIHLDDIIEQKKFEQSKDYINAIDDVKEFLKENYPDDYREFINNQNEE